MASKHGERGTKGQGMGLGADGTAARGRRSTWLAAALATVPIVALPATGAAASAAAAAEFDYFPPEPARVLTLSLIPHGNDDDLQGVMCQAPRTCEMVQNSYLSRSVAVENLDAALRDGTTGRQYVFAYSQGARVVSLWLEERSQVEGAPTPDDLGFVLMGNPGRKYGGADVEWDNVIPETDYHVIDVSRQYDAASDFPDNPFNLLALLNANAGFLFVHQDYESVDIYDPANYVWTEGNTTYVYVPTKNLPLLEPLRWIGLSAVADALNEPLKEIVERAYDRSYLPAEPGLPAPEPEPEPEPQVEEEAPAGQTSEEPAATLVAAKTVAEGSEDAEVQTTEDADVDEGADEIDDAEESELQDEEEAALGDAELEEAVDADAEAEASDEPGSEATESAGSSSESATDSSVEGSDADDGSTSSDSDAGGPTGSDE